MEIVEVREALKILIHLFSISSVLTFILWAYRGMESSGFIDGVYFEDKEGMEKARRIWTWLLAQVGLIIFMSLAWYQLGVIILWER